MISEIINSILAPDFLVSRIGLISLILGATILVIFSDFVNKNFVFPLAEYIKSKSRANLQNTKANKKLPWIAKFSSEALATIVFLTYCYFGSAFLAEYIFSPILSKVSYILLPVLIGLFVLISYTINNKVVRNKFIKF